MKFFINKKGEALTLVLIVLIVVVFIGWLINLNQRECRSNNDCGSGYYCGSDFTCHQIPTIEKTLVQNNLVLPSVIIGIAIVIAAFILRFGNLRVRRNQDLGAGEQKEENKLRAP